MEQYLLGDVLFSWDDGGYPLKQNEFMRRFRFDGNWTGARVTFRAAFEPLTPYRDYPLLLENDVYSVYQVNGERLVMYHWAYLRDAFGVWLDRLEQGREDVISFDPAIRQQQQLTQDRFIGLSGLHKALLWKDHPVLHAAYVDVGGQAVLFTAPSGTGKSTQAELWRRFAGAEVINGDRVLLGKRKGVWYAHGFPICGSSRICVNRSLPICAIVSLTQAPENKAERMTVGQQLRCLTGGMAVYPFESGDIAHASALAGEILSGVEVLRLRCRADEGAVDTLKSWLEEKA